MVKQLARPTMCQAYVLASDLFHRTSEQTVDLIESAP